LVRKCLRIQAMPPPATRRPGVSSACPCFSPLIRRRSLHAIDDKNIYRARRRFQFHSKLFLQRREDRWTVWIHLSTIEPYGKIVWRRRPPLEIEIIKTWKMRAVDDKAFDAARGHSR